MHQRRAEEGQTGLILERHAQRLFQRRPHRLERRGLAGSFDPRQAVAGVGGKQPGQVTGLNQRGAMGHCPAQILPQPGANGAGKGPWGLQAGLEGGGGLGQPEGLQLGGPALGILAEQHEVSRVGHQDQPVHLPIAAHLGALGGQPRIIAGGLDLNHAAFGSLPLARLTLLHLLGGVEADVGMPRALLRQLADAEHLGLERAADGVQQVDQRRVVGTLVGRAAGRTNPAQVIEVVLNCRRKSGVGVCHSPLITAPQKGIFSARSPEPDYPMWTYCTTTPRSGARDSLPSAVISGRS